MSDADVAGVIAFMARYPELAFEQWEDEALLRRMLRAQKGHCLVARKTEGGDFVGALIGGLFCGRATISHVGMLPEARSQGYGRAIVRHSLDQFRTLGAKRCHVLVTVDNKDGRRFWNEHMRFAEPANLRTFEHNLDVPNEGALAKVEKLNRGNADVVREFLTSHAPEELGHFDDLLHFSQQNGTATGACFLTRERGAVSGVAIVGTYGVRGVLHRVAHVDPTSVAARHLTEAALEWLRQHAVLRVHGFYDPRADPMVPCYRTIGFADRSEEMLELSL